MLPTYGTPLRQLIFEPNDSTLTARAKKMIVDSILAWEPRIVISDIEVNSSIDRQSLNEFDTYEEKEAILYIRIKFIDPENIQTVEELVLESPIGG